MLWRSCLDCLNWAWLSGLPAVSGTGKGGSFQKKEKKKKETKTNNNKKWPLSTICSNFNLKSAHAVTRVLVDTSCKSLLIRATIYLTILHKFDVTVCTMYGHFLLLCDSCFCIQCFLLTMFCCKWIQIYERFFIMVLSIVLIGQFQFCFKLMKL